MGELERERGVELDGVSVRRGRNVKTKLRLFLESQIRPLVNIV